MTADLSHHDRHLLQVCVDRYIADLRTACEEDQGTPDGKPGTLGHGMQTHLHEVREKLNVYSAPSRLEDRTDG